MRFSFGYEWSYKNSRYYCTLSNGAATSSAAGTAGYMSAPAAGDEAKVFKGDATWKADNVT